MRKDHNGSTSEQPSDDTQPYCSPESIKGSCNLPPLPSPPSVGLLLALSVLLSLLLLWNIANKAAIIARTPRRPRPRPSQREDALWPALLRAALLHHQAARPASPETGSPQARRPSLLRLDRRAGRQTASQGHDKGGRSGCAGTVEAMLPR